MNIHEDMYVPFGLISPPNILGKLPKFCCLLAVKALAQKSPCMKSLTCIITRTTPGRYLVSYNSSVSPELLHHFLSPSPLGNLHPLCTHGLWVQANITSMGIISLSTFFVISHLTKCVSKCVSSGKKNHHQK